MSRDLLNEFASSRPAKPFFGSSTPASQLNKNKKGITLLEIMIAVVFFGIIAVGLSLPVSRSLYLTADNKNINVANSLAKSYLNSLQEKWQLIDDFDQGQLVDVDNTYTDNGKFTVTVSSQDLETDSDGTVLIKRVNITYKDGKNDILCNIFYDYSRPVSF